MIVPCFPFLGCVFLFKAVMYKRQSQCYEGCSFCDVRGSAICRVYATELTLVSGESFNLTLLRWAKFDWPQRPRGFWQWQKKKRCHQLCLKTMNPKADQRPQSQGHCDLPKEAKHLGSGPSLLQSRLDSMWLSVVPPHQTWLGRNFLFSRIHFGTSKKQ